MYAPGDVTLYIPCFNAGKTLQSCLDGVAGQTVKPARILLIDDGSDIPLGEHKGCETIRHPVNEGLAAARNTALKACRTHLIASLDADVVASPDWLDQMLETFNVEGSVGVGGCLKERFSSRLADRWRSVHMAQNWGMLPLKNPRFLYGANTLFGADFIREVGGYDRRCRTNNEDRLLCEAFYAQQYDLFYTPEAHCEHLRQDSVRSVLRGFWQWHHAKGVLEGDFDSVERLMGRISRVNFGIFNYRYSLDLAAERKDLLGLDLLIPWVFSFLDLALFEKRHHGPVPSLILALEDPIRSWILKLQGPTAPIRGSEPWHEDYLAEMNRQVRLGEWHQAAQKHMEALLMAVTEAE